MGKSPPRKDHSESASLSKDACGSDVPAVVPSDGLGKAESEADTGLRPTSITPIKASKDVG